MLRKQYYHNLVLSSKPTTIMKSKLSNLKDKVSQINQNNVIYSVDCDKIYIGKSTRNLSKRIHEHKNNVVRHQPNSLVFQHVALDNHKINWDNPKFIDKNNHWKNENS